MIGQEALKQQIRQWVDNNSFPRFLIITGARGSGKKLMASYIREVMHCTAVNCDSGVDKVRDIVELAYKVGTPTLYIFADADKMSTQAKNALLKVTEEPPKQAYFIMTVEDIGNTLLTLKSRGTELSMDNYGVCELLEYCGDKKIADLADTPGQCDALKAIGVDTFIAFVEKVIDNIGDVSGVNAFKIANNFKFKDDAEGYDPILFFQCAISICSLRIFELAPEDGEYIYKLPQVIEWAMMIKCCSEYKNKFKITGVKKDSLFDMWILEMRNILKTK